ncbi:ABC transporter ATP-binding protein [Neobacillus sp.]|uniref:ABC transporter ATP-binding protein n=1 Tax=Neobacillus sp. TaxID=2675273 RepID=UPI00289F720C|nr:ABC transporter ATP-binding protein [Neobacillus sp.]
MFEIKNISKRYNGEFALNDISFRMGKGLNFIVGSSGSGKTTLLKIMSGMEQDFDGEVLYCGKSIKELTSNEKSYFYNNIFGFVWQDFNLLEDGTVLENVLLPQYLKNNKNKKVAVNILKELKIFDIAEQKVKYLSGGQKQRIAIARELMKNPQVIIADEPTSALDKKTAKITMDILRDISKSRTVIVVTHDTSLITSKDNIFELDKGELISKSEIVSFKSSELKIQNSHSLSIKNAFILTKSNIKSKFGRFVIATLALMVAGILLLTTVNGTVENSSQGEFDKLIDTYGDALLDIGLYNSFTDAAGTDGKENDKPSGEVTQDISGLYDVYAKDERVAFTAYLQAIDNIKIILDGKEYQIKSSGSTPTINKLVAGKMPMGTGNEVVVPESFVKTLGISPKEVIGKEIMFKGAISDWSNGTPISKNTSSKAKIVGVMDTTVKYDYAGQVMEYTVDDSFLFSKAALADMLNQAGMDIGKLNFLFRAKTPADMIAIKDELNEKGIVPIGRFELVEDLVRLNTQTTEQSGSASAIVGVLSVIVVIAIFLITGFMRKREFAIYKVSGFNNKQLSLLNLTETTIATITAIVIMFITSPLLNMATKSLFNVNISNSKMMVTGVLMMVAMAVVAYLTTSISIIKTNITTALKTGDR